LEKHTRSRTIDFAVYIGIGLLLIGFLLLVAVRFANGDVALQLIEAFFTACILVTYIIHDQWKRSQHKSLLGYCVAIVVAHFSAYAIVFRTLGPMRAMAVGVVTVLELAVAGLIAEKVVPRKYRSGR
jgi:vacuolar-type H+-ATPase subunit I/STV1